MALNVNIIGRDSEGNLRALKVNSEGNLDFGQLETDIQAVKDNQGRLYGKHGEVWIPVKVDSEGRPIIASDVTVTADGLIVDLGQIKQGPAGTEPWPVQLSGTIIVNPASSKGWISALATVSKTEKVKGRGASIFVWSDTRIPVKVRGISSIAETYADPLSLGTVERAGRVYQFKIPVEVLPADNLELIFENPVDWSIRYQYQLFWEV